MPIDLLTIGKLLLLVGAGFIGSFYGANVGGGSLVSIPALIFTGLPIPLVIATNRFAVVWLELTAFLSFRKSIAIDNKFTLLCGILGSTGAFAGSRIMLTIDRNLLSMIVAAILVSIVIFLLMRKDWGKGGIDLSRQHKILILCAIPFIGFYGGFFGAAHGLFTLMLLTGFGLKFSESAAMARLIGLMVAITASLSFWQAGVIQWIEGAALTVGFVAGAWSGARFGLKRGAGFMRKLLIAVALASAMKLIWDFIG